MHDVSLNEMARRMDGLINTKHVTDFESRVLQMIARKSQGGKDVSGLSPEQEDFLMRTHGKYFK